VCVELEKIWKWMWDIGVLFNFFLEGMGRNMIKRQNSLFSD